MTVPQEPSLYSNITDEALKKCGIKLLMIPCHQETTWYHVFKPANSLISTLMSDGDGALLGSFQGHFGSFQGQNSIAAQG